MTYLMYKAIDKERKDGDKINHRHLSLLSPRMPIWTILGAPLRFEDFTEDGVVTKKLTQCQ